MDQPQPEDVRLFYSAVPIAASLRRVPQRFRIRNGRTRAIGLNALLHQREWSVPGFDMEFRPQTACSPLMGAALRLAGEATNPNWLPEMLNTPGPVSAGINFRSAVFQLRQALPGAEIWP